METCHNTQRQRRTRTLGIQHAAVSPGTCVPHRPKPMHACVRPGGNGLICDKGAGRAPHMQLSMHLMHARNRVFALARLLPAEPGQGTSPCPRENPHRSTAAEAKKEQSEKRCIMRYAGPASARNQGPPNTVSDFRFSIFYYSDRRTEDASHAGAEHPSATVHV